MIYYSVAKGRHLATKLKQLVGFLLCKQKHHEANTSENPNLVSPLLTILVLLSLYLCVSQRLHFFMQFTSAEHFLQHAVSITDFKVVNFKMKGQ